MYLNYQLSHNYACYLYVCCSPRLVREGLLHDGVEVTDVSQKACNLSNYPYRPEHYSGGHQCEASR
jgi:hypothetical protein